MPRRYDRICSARTQNCIKWISTALLALFVLAILTVLSLILVDLFGKSRVEATIKDARLNTFGFTTRNSGGTTAASFLSYNISVALEVLVPSRIIRIKYSQPFIATLVFHDQRLQSIIVVEKGHKNRRRKKELYRLHIAGEVLSSLLVAAAIEDFKKQNATGVFNVELRLSGKIKRNRLSMSCALTLHLAPPGPEVLVFREVDCKPDREDKMYF